MDSGDSDRKTHPTDADVTAFLDAVPDPRRRADALDALDLIREVTGAEPRTARSTSGSPSGSPPARPR